MKPRCAALLAWATVLAAEFGCGRSASADQFTLAGFLGSRTLEARLVVSTSEVTVLEQADGQMRLIPPSQILNRKLQDGPEPVDSKGMIAVLEKEFGKDRLRTTENAPYIVGVVLAAPLKPEFEPKVAIHLQQAVGYMGRIDRVFTAYAQKMGLELEPSRFPLVMLIFESDEDFNKYTERVSGGSDLSTNRILGFYSGLTNWLAVRMSECFSFEVPLHEAIHQQAFNRGLFQRLAPVPVWFNEGIATGFENEGNTIAGNPSKINAMYAAIARADRSVSWETLVQDDRAFHGDVLAGAAYSHAWCLHWMLATGYPAPYREYVRQIGQRTALQEVTGEQRLADFERTFGTSVRKLQADFPGQLAEAAKKQRIKFPSLARPGQIVVEEGMVEAKVNAVVLVDRGGDINVRGTVKNRSSFREWMVYVRVTTDGGTYAEWMLSRVGAGQTATLSLKKADLRIPGAAVGPARAFAVEVFTALPDSDEARQWPTGRVPAPRRP